MDLFRASGIVIPLSRETPGMAFPASSGRLGQDQDSNPDYPTQSRVFIHIQALIPIKIPGEGVAELILNSGWLWVFFAPWK